MEQKARAILAVETSGAVFSCAVVRAGSAGAREAEGEAYLDVGLRHSSVLKRSCEFLFAALAVAPADLSLLAVSTGPGSFTGLRVGIAFTRALAQSLRIPLSAVPTFEILAAEARALRPGSTVALLIESVGE